MGKDIIKQFNQSRDRLADVFIDDKKRIENLRLILCKELNRDVSFEEARELATDLISLYKSLAQGKKIVLGGLKNKNRLKEG